MCNSGNDSMAGKEAKLVYFSPTDTTRKVVEAVAKGLGLEKTEKIDLTIEKNLKEKYEFEKGEFIIIGVPVYSGRVPVVAAERIKLLKGENNPTVVIAVYGNRHYDDALIELRNLALESGMIPLAAGAFIGEHSFSTEDNPTAVGRPDKEDLAQAEELGKKLIAKIDSAEYLEDLFPPIIPGNFPYKERNGAKKVVPETDSDKCGLCGNCVEVCPVNAIRIEGSVITNEELCIHCCACIKKCPNEAREYNNDFIKGISVWLHENCAERKEPELFV